MDLKSRKVKMECDHKWVKGPFNVMIPATDELAKYLVPPMAFYEVEHCTKCGTIRLPKELRLFGE